MQCKNDRLYVMIKKKKKPILHTDTQVLHVFTGGF